MRSENKEESRNVSLDLSGIEFRRRRTRIEHADEHRYAGLWWRIALGVFVGLLAHSIVAGLYLRWEIHAGLKAMGIEAETFERELGGAADSLSQSPGRPTSISARQSAYIRPLDAGERCVGDKRFRRVPNGWVQVLEPCN